MPITEAVGKQRRFMRSRYLDPHWSQFRPGEYTEGYDDDAWKNSELNHSWILKRNPLLGIDTLRIDASLVGIVGNMVSKILKTLDILYDDDQPAIDEDDDDYQSFPVCFHFPGIFFPQVGKESQVRRLVKERR
jgi:hypothetical protein